MDDSFVDVDHLIHEVSQEHHERARTLFHEVGLYRGQPGIIKLLSERDGQTQTELANAMRVQPATVNKMIQRMEHSGFLTRSADPNDQRVSRVFLTDHARGVRAEIDKIFATLADEELRGFTQEERIAVQGFLIRLRDNLRFANKSD